MKNSNGYLIMGNDWLKYCISCKPKLREIWKREMHRDIDIDNPKTFTEKLQWIKIYDSSFLKTFCSDKLTVRNYCLDKLGKDYFIPVISVYEKFDDIDFSKLPKDYVLKTNHGSHTNIIVRNGNIDINSARRKFNEWLSKDWTWWGLELAYKPIPRKIFAEKYMNDGHNELIDYKFLCFNGIPKFCQVISQRNEKGQHLNYYDMNFNPCKEMSRIDFPSNYDIPDNKPKNWQLMKETAKILSEDFNFVRVDFYEINGNMYISELTFYPYAGFIKYKNAVTDKMLGDMLIL